MSTTSPTSLDNTAAISRFYSVRFNDHPIPYARARFTEYFKNTPAIVLDAMTAQFTEYKTIKDRITSRPRDQNGGWPLNEEEIEFTKTKVLAHPLTDCRLAAKIERQFAKRYRNREEFFAELFYQDHYFDGTTEFDREDFVRRMFVPDDEEQAARNQQWFQQRVAIADAEREQARLALGPQTEEQWLE